MSYAAVEAIAGAKPVSAPPAVAGNGCARAAQAKTRNCRASCCCLTLATQDKALVRISTSPRTSATVLPWLAKIEVAAVTVPRVVWVCSHCCVRTALRCRTVAARGCEGRCVCLVVAAGVYVIGYAANRVAGASSASAVVCGTRCVLVSCTCCKTV